MRPKLQQAAAILHEEGSEAALEFLRKSMKAYNANRAVKR